MDRSVRQQICNAFPDATPPLRPVTFHRCLECDEVDELLGGRVWSHVAADFPDYCHDAFPLLTPDAQAYYLPAYMLTAFNPPMGMQGMSIKSALQDGRLMPEQFTPLQRAAIILWVFEYYRVFTGGDPPPDLIERWHA